MKKTFSYFLILLLLIGGAQLAQAQSVEGNGIMSTENRSVAAFTGLAVSGGFEIILTQGNSESLKLEAEENILPLIKTEINDGVLTITTQPNSIRRAKNMKAYITVRELKKLDFSGGIKLISTNTLTGSTLKLDFSGGINVAMALQMKEVKADVSGGTKITLSGRAEKVHLHLSGAANLKAEDLKTDYLTMDASGVSNAEVNVSKELKVDGSGIVSVAYKGTPKLTHIGAGKVRPM